MRPILTTLLIAPLLAGCLGSAPPVPRDHYYRLLVPMPAEIEASGGPPLTVCDAQEGRGGTWNSAG
ncbi:MAG TPA: hypothetical protein VKP12_13775, partial [Kiloniellaceae bacterium]|nr:hypothetical protein [Kiloniellaceae bacterium]